MGVRAALQDPLAKPRLLAMAFLSTAWGCRLTYNFWIKGGFSGGEDYRWEQVRAWFPAGWRFETFNLVFICLFQVSHLQDRSPPQTPVGQCVAVGGGALTMIWLFLAARHAPWFCLGRRDRPAVRDAVELHRQHRSLPLRAAAAGGGDGGSPDVGVSGA